MSLTLHYHPLSSFCQKVLIALYEYETPFESHLLNLGDEDSSSEFKRLWPMGKMPVLRDEAPGADHPRIQHHHRVSDAALPRRDTADPGRSRPRPADAAARPLLRPLCHGADAEDRHRQVAAGRGQRSARRGPGQGHAADRLRHDRGGDGGAELGRGRPVQHGRLRCRPLLCSTPTSCCPSTTRTPWLRPT